ncbi:MAG TPA: hypothetical protein VK766_00310 [Cytophagaceae bacterium]|jgi:hypothetical protein|nr:hypothetical protein [Cytophagaceae bacterium]
MLFKKKGIYLKRVFQLFLVVLIVVISFFSKAQEKELQSANAGKDTSIHLDQKDFFLRYRHSADLADVARFILHKDFGARLEGKRKSGQPYLSFVPAAGYTLQTGFAGVVSSNIAFYTSDSADQKLSSINASISYSQHNQVIFPIQLSLWTKENKYNIVSEVRYMKYPSPTYGLGGSSSFRNGYTVDFSYLKFHQTIYKRVLKNTYAGIGYFLDYLWNIREIGQPANMQTSFEKYGFNRTEIASGVALRFLHDSRLNQINPKNGFYSNIVYRPNFTFMGSQNNWESLLLEFRKYLRLPGRSKNVIAFWSYNWLTTGGKPQYLLLPSTGWDDTYNTGRGYIQGRFRGKNMLYLESEYRFGITRNGLLGGVVFANIESFSGALDKKLENISPGWGAGLRIKLNKFSGANLCIDYGFGLDGSRGFFVNLGEVF